MSVHRVKCWPVYFEAIGDGRKRFEVRKDDRGYEVGDLLHLDEYDPEKGELMNRWIVCRIIYKMKGGIFGVAEGYCVLGIELPANHQWPIENVFIPEDRERHRDIDYEKERDYKEGFSL